MIIRYGIFGKIKSMPRGSYPIPRILPIRSHPRLLITEGLIYKIRAKLKKEEYSAVAEEFYKLKDTDFSEVMTPENVKSGYALGVIEAKAYYSLSFGDKECGHQAIKSILEYLENASFNGFADDYRAMGQAMFTAAEVYDWCYDLLTDEDRYRIVALVENQIAPKMEIGMPPCKYGVIVGHQAEAQLLRDWLSFAIAVYDEYPDVYNFVGGRFFALYVPARNYWYETESTLQGSSYGGYRFTWDLWSAWIFKRMSGRNIYSKKMSKIPEQWLMYRRPDGQGIRDGDDYAELGGRWDQYGFPWFYAGNLFGNPVYRCQAFKKIGRLNRFFYNELTLTPVQILLFDNLRVGEKEDYSDLPLVKHYKDPCGLTVARTGWNIGKDSKDIMVFMKIGGLWSANHHHMDFGAFQIFYKGILASDSGAYVRYGSPHDMSYNKQTIAHNCLLVYDPKETNGPAVNSGGQLMIVPGEPLDLDHWLSDPRYKMGEVLAHDENKEAVYIAGDITKAYGKKVKEVIRRMMFIPVENERIHGIFAVSDKVVSSNPSFRKTFMLHCQQEPQIIGDKTVIRRTGSPESFHGLPLSYDGMLVNQTLLPENASIEMIGGEGKEFMINGENYPIPISGKLKPSAETGWGRIEICPKEASAEDEFLNIMFICDNGELIEERATLLGNKNFVGALVLNNVILFPKSRENIDEKFEICVNQKREQYSYRITGLASGKWEVYNSEHQLLSSFDVEESSGTLNVTLPFNEIYVVPQLNED